MWRILFKKPNVRVCFATFPEGLWCEYQLPMLKLRNNCISEIVRHYVSLGQRRYNTRCPVYKKNNLECQYLISHLLHWLTLYSVQFQFKSIYMVIFIIQETCDCMEALKAPNYLEYLKGALVYFIISTQFLHLCKGLVGIWKGFYIYNRCKRKDMTPQYIIFFVYCKVNKICKNLFCLFFKYF